MQNKKTDHNYINIMSESLERKLKVLMQIIEVNEMQEKILKAEEMDYEAFDRTLSQKEQWINEINVLDEGFQSVYDRIKEDITENKAAYSEDIKTLQEKIREVTDRTMDVQTQEARNKELFQNRSYYTKQEIMTAKSANKVAANYYQNMNRLNVVGSQFLDTKK